MSQNQGNQYRVRIVQEDGIEKLTGWMNSMAQVAQQMLTAQKLPGTSYWLQVRNILCPNCSVREQFWEYPIMHIPSPRFIPHDSRYLLAVGWRDRSEVFQHGG